MIIVEQTQWISKFISWVFDSYSMKAITEQLYLKHYQSHNQQQA